jgi:hypothetical protein
MLACVTHHRNLETIPNKGGAEFPDGVENIKDNENTIK